MNNMKSPAKTTGLQITSPEENLGITGGFLPLLLLAGGAVLAYTRINASNAQSNHGSKQVNVHCNDCTIFLLQESVYR